MGTVRGWPRGRVFLLPPERSGGSIFSLPECLYSKIRSSYWKSLRRDEEMVFEAGDTV